MTTPRATTTRRPSRKPPVPAASSSMPATLKPGIIAEPASAAREARHRRSGRGSEMMIAEAAYYLAEKRGFAPGGELQDWLEAEAQIEAWLRASGRRPRRGHCVPTARPSRNEHRLPNGTCSTRSSTAARARQLPGPLTKSTLALILAGGRGSRLEELTDWRAKPSIPVRRQVPDHRLRAVELRQFGHPPHRDLHAVQGAKPDPARAARLELSRRPLRRVRRAAAGAAADRGDLVPGHRRRGLPEPRHPAAARSASTC